MIPRMTKKKKKEKKRNNIFKHMHFKVDRNKTNKCNFRLQLGKENASSTFEIVKQELQQKKQSTKRLMQSDIVGHTPPISQPTAV